MRTGDGGWFGVSPLLSTRAGRTTGNQRDQLLNEQAQPRGRVPPETACGARRSNREAGGYQGKGAPVKDKRAGMNLQRGKDLGLVALRERPAERGPVSGLAPVALSERGAGESRPLSSPRGSESPCGGPREGRGRPRDRAPQGRPGALELDRDAPRGDRHGAVSRDRRGGGRAREGAQRRVVRAEDVSGPSRWARRLARTAVCPERCVPGHAERDQRRRGVREGALDSLSPHASPGRGLGPAL